MAGIRRWATWEWRHRRETCDQSVMMAMRAYRFVDRTGRARGGIVRMAHRKQVGDEFDSRQAARLWFCCRRHRHCSVGVDVGAASVEVARVLNLKFRETAVLHHL